MAASEPVPLRERIQLHLIACDKCWQARVERRELFLEALFIKQNMCDVGRTLVEEYSGSDHFYAEDQPNPA